MTVATANTLNHKGRDLPPTNLAILPGTGIRAEWRLVSPGLARTLLAGNTHNRILRPLIIEKYARDMRENRWPVDGATIRFSTGGTLLDGQHRLAAIAEAGIGLWCLIVYGLPEAAQESMDRGLGRNLADALRLRQEKNVNVLAAATSVSFALHSESPTSTWPSTPEALQFLEAHPEIRESLSFGAMMQSAVRAHAGPWSGLHHVLASIDRDDADAFFNQLAAGTDLAADSPLTRLREVLLRDLTATRRTERWRLMALAIKSWNAWRKGEPMLLLRWAVGGSKPEAYPRAV